MKKILLTIFATVIGCLTAMAGSELKVEKGDKKDLKENVKVYINFDWEGATWDNRIPLTEQLGGDYQDNINGAEDAFISEFNKIKGMILSKDPTDSEYTAIFKTTKMDGHMGVGLKIGWESIVWGTFTIYKDGTIIYQVKITDFEGPKDLSRDDSISKVYKKLAQKIKK